MAKIKPFIIILFTAIVFAQSNSLSTQSSIPGTKDKLILVNEVYPDIYDGFKIIRDKETIFIFHKDTFLFEAVGTILHKVISAGRTFIVLPVYNSPHYGWYLASMA